MERPSRFDLFWPVREIINFFVYRKYVKKFDTTTEEGRKWLYELKRNMEIMGFNDGIETFQTNYETQQRVGRAIVQDQLKHQDAIQKAAERDATIRRIFAEVDARCAEHRAKEKREREKRERERAERDRMGR